MKTMLTARRVAILALALATAGVTATFAQTASTSTNAPTGTAPACFGRHHHHDSILSVSERAQLRKARQAALAANPGLQTERASLKQQFQALKSQGATTPAQWAALRQQKQTLRSQLRAAELSIDPTLAPIFAKLDAVHHHHST